MRIALLGGPGAGKGTQAAYISDAFSIPQISTGDMLRNHIDAGTDVGKAAKNIIDAGNLVSDAIIIRMVKQRITKPDCAGGYLLDGFPRTIPQAVALKEAGIHLDVVIEIFIQDEEVVRRMSGRRVHLASGRTYHMIFNPPLVEGRDDISGEKLVQREDDQEDTVRDRLTIYHELTEPLVTYYTDYSKSGEPNAPRYFRVNGVGSLEEIKQQIFDTISA